VQKFIVCADCGKEELLEKIDISVLPREYGAENDFEVPHKRPYEGDSVRYIEHHTFRMDFSKMDMAAKNSAIAQATVQTISAQGGNSENIANDCAVFTVGAQSSIVLRTHCAGAGEILRWRVAVKAHNVQITACFESESSTNGEDNEDGALSVLEKAMFATSDMCQGEFTSPGAGVFMIELDNKHSTFRSKTVGVRVAVTPPTTTPETAI
jgi:hypothetical protein